MDACMKLEITVDSVSSASFARQGGADRIELCDNYHGGGTTPSTGSIEKAREVLDIPLFVLIRPRSGDFLYTDLEYEVMKCDILHAREAGADGIVVGILRSDGTVDMERMAELVAHSRPMQVTFHRAFDMTADPFEALEDIISTGADRILTSGQAPTALEGAPLIARLVKRAAMRNIVVPGAGINEDNIGRLRMITGATEFHASLRRKKISKMGFRRGMIPMGNGSVPEYEWDEASPERIARVKKILDRKDTGIPLKH